MLAHARTRLGMWVALCALGALSACGSGAVQTMPESSPTPAPVVIDISSLPGPSLDLSTMPVGAWPKVPWIEGQTLHNGTVDVTVGTGRWPESTSPQTFPFGDGSIRYDDIYGGRKTEIHLVDSAGAVTYSARARWPVLPSSDRTQVVWWEPDAQQVVIANLAAGSLTRTSPPWAEVPRNNRWWGVVGWLGRDDVLMRLEGPGENEDRYWRTSGEPAPQWLPRDVEGVSAEASLVFLPDYPYVDEGYGDSNCLTAVDVDTSAKVWRRCFALGDKPYPGLGPSVSPDGKHTLVASISITSGEPGFILVLDTAAGAALTRFDLGLYEGDNWGFADGMGVAIFEDGSHFVSVVSNAEHSASGEPTGIHHDAIVRCDLDGRCERTTPVRSYDATKAGPPPYRLE
jgi:hypothetical protein